MDPLGIASLTVTGAGLALSVIAGIGMAAYKLKKKYRVNVEPRPDPIKVREAALEDAVEVIERMKKEQEEITADKFRETMEQTPPQNLYPGFEDEEAQQVPDAPKKRAGSSSRSRR